MSIFMRLLYALCGTTLLAASAILSGVLLSYHIDDASLNLIGQNADNRDIQNLFGAQGAFLADFIIQTCGIGIWAIFPLIIMTGWLLLKGWRLNHIMLRIAAAAMGVVLLAFSTHIAQNGFGREVISAVIIQNANPLLSGGSLGHFLAARLAEFIAIKDTPINVFIVSLLGFFGGVSCAAYGGAILRPSVHYSAGFIRYLSAILVKLIRILYQQIAPRILRRPRPELPALDTPAPENEDAELHVEARKPKPKRGKRAKREAQTSLPLGTTSRFELPPLSIITEPDTSTREPTISKEALQANGQLLEGVLADFGIHGTINKVRPGPVVTLYELEPAPGIRSSRIIGLAEDIARSMSAIACRVAPVPGTNVIGIELPNQSRETVALRELLASAAYETSKSGLPLALGKDISGAPVIADLTKMPHLLVAGTTGSGKSVGINTMLLSILYRLTPEQCRLIMVDPKMLELSVYDDIPHLLTPVVTESKKAVVALKWAVQEMENRYRKMAKIGVRNMDGYNERMEAALKRGEPLIRQVQTGFDKDSGEAIIEEEKIPAETLPYIVIIIDEMADLMLIAGKDIEAVVQRLAQMARAAGIHLITATQRPSVDVITGTIKANFPSRISFQVTSKIDSRTVLGEQGAEQLLGKGDMLFMSGGARAQRVHGPFVADDEVERVVKFLKKQARPKYVDEVTEEPDETLTIDGGGAGGKSLYDQAVAVILRDNRVSISYIQRRLQIGYNKAASLIEEMETRGIVSPPNHAGKREILADNPSEHP